MDKLLRDTGLQDEYMGSKVKFVHPYSVTLCVSPVAVVNGSDWVTLNVTGTDNDCGAYQCQQIGSPVKCMMAIRPLVMYSGQSYCAVSHDVCLKG